MFRNRLFWIAAGAVFLIHFNNYLYQWFPEYLVPVQRVIDLRPLGELSDTFMRSGHQCILRSTVFFAVIGISYFLVQEVSLSIGIGPIVFGYVTGALLGFGISPDASMGGASGAISSSSKR